MKSCTVKGSKLRKN